MEASGPVLDLAGARAQTDSGEASAPAINLRLMPGELVLIDMRRSARSAWLADLCCGLLPLSEGSARFLGRDWSAVPDDYANALRGRIGRVFPLGSWIGFIDVASNILLPQLHHTRDDAGALRERAAALCCAFGLPGLPLARPGELAASDLARAACVRAFLGDPMLVVLENPVQGRFATLIPPLLDAVADARDRGAGAVWLTRSDLVWRDPSIPATIRLRLDGRGLVPSAGTR